MTSKIKAKFTNGVLAPLEPLDLAEGDEVTMQIETRDGAAQPPSDEDWQYDQTAPNINEMMDGIRARLAHLPREEGPTDGAKNYKHYLYGHPKVD